MAILQPQELDHYLRLLAAVVLALPVGWQRELHDNLAGLRTFPLVSPGACGYVLLGSEIAQGNEEAMARILQGLLAGIGFIGGGSILKHDKQVEGVATATSIWIVGAIGAAVGLGHWGLAIVLMVLNLVLMIVLTQVKKRLKA